MRRVRRDDPETFDLSALDAFDDLVVRQRVSLRDARGVDAENACDFFPMFRVCEIMAAEQKREFFEKIFNCRLEFSRRAALKRA